MMKLAEALILRADAQKRIENLRQRLIKNAKVQEGESPIEDPQALLLEHDELALQLREMIQRINRTNSSTMLEGEPQMTVADAIALRDSLRLTFGTYSALCEAATVEQSRYSRSEIKFLPALDVRAIRAQSDAYAVQQRELDARIQATSGWSTWSTK
jgi:hypothetical protein